LRAPETARALWQAKNLAAQIPWSYNYGMKNTGRKSVKGGTTSAPMLVKATTTKVSVTAVKRSPTADEIARRSYQIFLEHGGEHGHDVEHWIQAERDLSA
jgi:hypothetical protein